MSEKQLLDLIKKKDEDFFNQNVFTDKQEYIDRITEMMKSINETAVILGDTISMTRSGSIVQSWAAPEWGNLMAAYKKDVKAFENHVSFFKQRIDK